MASPVAAARTVIESWHVQDATIPAIEALAEAFNAAQDDYQLVPRLAAWCDANPMARVGLEQFMYAAPRPQLAAYAVWQEYLEGALERSLLGGWRPRRRRLWRSAALIPSVQSLRSGCRRGYAKALTRA